MRVSPTPLYSAISMFMDPDTGQTCVTEMTVYVLGNDTWAVVTFGDKPPQRIDIPRAVADAWWQGCFGTTTEGGHPVMEPVVVRDPVNLNGSVRPLLRDRIHRKHITRNPKAHAA